MHERVYDPKKRPSYNKEKLQACLGIRTYTRHFRPRVTTFSKIEVKKGIPQLHQHAGCLSVYLSVCPPGINLIKFFAALSSSPNSPVVCVISFDCLKWKKEAGGNNNNNNNNHHPVCCNSRISFFKTRAKTSFSCAILGFCPQAACTLFVAIACFTYARAVGSIRS